MMPRRVLLSSSTLWDERHQTKACDPPYRRADDFSEHVFAHHAPAQVSQNPPLKHKDEISINFLGISWAAPGGTTGGKHYHDNISYFLGISWAVPGGTTIENHENDIFVSISEL